MVARVACLLGLALVSGCREMAPTKPPAPPTVLVDRVVQRNVVEYVESVGVVDGYVNAEIRARVSGYLKSQDYDDGARVKAGQLLFTIDPEEYRAQVALARGNVARAEAAETIGHTQLERQEQLVRMKAVSEEAYDQALAATRDAAGQAKAAKAALRQAELDLSYTELRSPVDGIAGLPHVRVGNLVGKEEPTLLTTVSQIDPIRVRFSLSEADYLRYAKKFPQLEGRDLAWAERQFQELARLGQTEDGTPGIELWLADDSVYPRRGVIVAADREIDPSTGTIRLEGLFPNPERLLRPGQYGRVRMARTATDQSSLVVAEKALVSVQGTYSVAVVGSDDKVQLRRVEVGARSGEARVITEGVEEGERVVVDGLQKVRDGMQVIPKAVPMGSSLTHAEPLQAPLRHASVEGD
jgi:membrane fusion protein (multidrug efflux system)